MNAVRLILPALGLLLAVPAEAFAYIGPGAGFAFIGSFFVLFWAFLLALFTLLTYPFRLVRQAFRRRRIPRDAPRRTVILGFDGMDPELTRRWMDEGKLPNFAALTREGGFRKLATTHPPLSPVAWSSFMTGVHPARHGIFDFLARDTRSYLPVLSTSAIEAAKRILPIGKFQVPLGRPRIRLFRKAPPFWKLLGEHGVFSSVIRVPATFPPDRHDGHCLAGMSVPDLRGTQGSFTYFTDASGEASHTGGLEVRLEQRNGRLEGTIPGPDHPFRPDAGPLGIPLVVETGNGDGRVAVRAGDQRFEIGTGEYSPWIPLTFVAGLGVKVRGIARFRLAGNGSGFGLYMTPIHIDPERPALPISHPRSYGTYLAKLMGPFATLGLAEDTWALNERVLDEQGFLDQANFIQEEREKQLFDALAKTRTGLVVCVFDATDRIQHMFYRYNDPDPRADCPGDRDRFSRAVEDAYRRADEVLGKVRESIDDRTVLLVLSDHGFASFRRGVNLNAWLHREGYLVLREGTSGESDYLRDVDWSKTRAYAVGLAGLYLNLRGREAQGIVAPGDEAAALKEEIAARLVAVRDPDGDRQVVREAVDVSKRYQGPYLDQAPDLVIGYADGYRVAWEAAVGTVAGEEVSDNRKSWSGDHCVDPALVPGILLCNRPIAAETPSIVDVAPTVLELYGIPRPRHMEGTSLGMGAGRGHAPRPARGPEVTGERSP